MTHADIPTPAVAMVWVAIGGAIGAVARYLVTLLAATYWPALPLGTLAVNIVGCLLIGLLAGLGDALSAPWRLLLITGLCGGFTTYSAIIYELDTIGRAQDWWASAGYLLATLVGGIAALGVGYWLSGAGR